MLMSDITPFNAKRLLILGLGYLGGRVAEQALAKGMQVTSMTRDP